ncbi:putative septation protein SpoVG [bioreactor metagenome]|uniref:Putative septation protein SpoVG n=1 Tax=bioreactor metagenome TaxID=1076179 RepID=A0A645JKS8_9ZZZZ
MPSRKNKNEEYRDICFPITPELHKTIKETVLEAYQNQPAEPDEAE